MNSAATITAVSLGAGMIILTVLFAWFFYALFKPTLILGGGNKPVEEEFDVMENNRRAIDEGNFEQLTFTTAKQGYDKAQVDAVIADLLAKLAAAEAKLSESGV
ncbi:hypothetical protein P4N68_09155 [Corynebacterium felinum]|uniref:DivIVA domain-containing protein n=1 Tax=Corynebacterium felinum TaxID=131318 RepID=A0ABU2B9F4_9CORY|nr:MULTISPECIES: hypothetical protein [Corynebacterium]MDF5821241.1 hypothetical protein [Corynebacterium felinum]MDO4762256.1 hypothetical protein [Corynebacterium sp.]MDR7355240.1 hypothetical protein [Corynebacterium felinum]WJY94591.1 hypothetical protein CFELI_04810 [Corynebacterium felinum]